MSSKKSKVIADTDPPSVVVPGLVEPDPFPVKAEPVAYAMFRAVHKKEPVGVTDEGAPEGKRGLIVEQDDRGNAICVMWLNAGDF